MKLITIYEGKTVNAINIDDIEALVMSELEIKVVCPKYNYYESFKTVEETKKRYNELTRIIRLDGEFE